MEEMETSPTSVLVDHVYLQHTGSEWGGDHRVRYQSYLVPENHDFPSAIAFAQGESIAFGSKKATVSPEKDLD